MGAHDEDGCDLDFAGVSEWISEYLGEELSCAVRAPSDERIDSSAFHFAGVVAQPRDAPPESEHRIWVAVGNGLITLLDSDFVSARAHYAQDVDIHSLYVRCQGFALLVSAGPPPARC
jgi:hypothetical protein